MAISTIQTGLRIVEVPTTAFAWNSGSKSYQATTTTVITASGLDTVVAWYAQIHGNGDQMLSVVLRNDNKIRIFGLSNSSLTQFTGADTELPAISLYAIGY